MISGRLLWHAILAAAWIFPALVLAEPTPAAAKLDDADGSALTEQLREREAKIERLSPEERQALRAAQQRALSSPEVREALAKRDAAMAEFQRVFFRTMVNSDPAVGPILKKIANGAARGY